MPGDRPRFNITCKPKKGGRSVSVLAAWPTQYGFNVQLAKDVKLIVAGVEVTTGKDGEFWMNLYDNSESQERDDGPPSGWPGARGTPSTGGGPAKHTEPPEKQDDDIPF